MKKTKYCEILSIVVCTVVGIITILLGLVASDFNRVWIGLVQVVLAIILYFAFILTVSGRNWMDIRAVFSAVWVSTIGLATMRLAEYQEVWQSTTWFLLAVAYALFQIGATVGIYMGKRSFERAIDKIKRISPFELALNPNRLYYICIITTTVGLLCLAINVLIRGYIPCFNSSENSYAKFYTKFYLFAVAASMISGLCYYCIKTQNCSKVQVIALYLCILYSTIIFPLLVVSRGTFVTSALSLATSVFYLHKKKLFPLVLCAVMIVGIYLFASELRGYTDEQLKAFFEPATVSLNGKEEEMSVKTDTDVSKEEEMNAKTDTDASVVTEPNSTETKESSTLEFTLSPSMSFLYAYLTNGHDNFNEAVQNAKTYTYGARQLQPFNVILRIQSLNDYLDNQEYYKVREHLNVTNILGDAYYDFHSWGVLLMLFWAAIFGYLQACTEQARGPFSMLALGNAMTPIVLSSFASWMSLFSQWMHWGLILILCITACLGKRKTK